jgi:hypothetical protein
MFNWQHYHYLNVHVKTMQNIRHTSKACRLASSAPLLEDAMFRGVAWVFFLVRQLGVGKLKKQNGRLKRIFPFNWQHYHYLNVHVKTMQNIRHTLFRHE